jgi:hypothetical protein
MKNLKHIKLFEGFYSLLEAFDASHLNKVFNYIKSKDEKKKFSSYVSAIAGHIDVPATAITDKYFQYLPYKDAIKKNLSMDLVDCKATSIGAFGDPTRRGGKGVAGDVCTGGKLKKSYGAAGRTREYDCPACNGTGKVNPAGQLKYLKFWLNSEGKFIGVTAVDGVYHANSKDVSQFKQIDITEEILSVFNTQNRNDATVKAGLEAIESKYELVSGKTKIAMEGLTNYRWRDPHGITIGTYWKDRDGKVYVACGNSTLDYKAQRPVGVKWKEFGSYISQIPYIFNAVQSNMNRGTIKILTDVEEKEDYLYNVGVQFTIPRGNGGGVSGFRLEDSLSKSFLSDAEFAIVFDFKQFEDDMISAETKNLSTIKDERTELKSGIIGGKLGISNTDIKNANIERYTKAISDVDITKGFDRLVKKLPRFFGGRYALFYLMEEKNFVSYRNNVANLLKFMSAEDDEQKKYYSDRVSERIKDVFKSNTEYSDKLDTRFKGYLDYLNDKLSVANEDQKILFQSQIDIFNKAKELSNKISEKISNMEVETVEDFEIIYSKVSGIVNALKADRTGLYDGSFGIRHIQYLWNYTEARRTSEQFLYSWNSSYGVDSDFDKKLQECLSKLDYMIRLVDRM